MKFTKLRYICKLCQDIHVHNDIAVLFVIGEKSRKYINEKLIELVCHIYKMEWGGFVCAAIEISTRYYH